MDADSSQAMEPSALPRSVPRCLRTRQVYRPKWHPAAVGLTLLLPVPRPPSPLARRFLYSHAHFRKYMTELPINQHHHPKRTMEKYDKKHARKRDKNETNKQIKLDIQLQSAYQAVMGSEPPYTNYTGNFKGVLDYVWFSSPHIRPLAVAPVPTAEDIMKCGIALPNVQSSSDHIMLLCDIQLGGGTGAQPPASPIFQGQQKV